MDDTTPKTLHNTTASQAKVNVSDLVIWGDGDMFKLLCKASSQAEGWMKSSKALEIDGAGCLVQVTTQQRNPDGSYSVAEALTWVPGVYIKAKVDAEGKVYARVLKQLRYAPGESLDTLPREEHGQPASEPIGLQEGQG